MKKPLEIKFSDEAGEVFDFLSEKSLSSKKERMLYESVRNKIEIIKSNHKYGDAIPKKFIPLYYKEKYGVNNLFRIELPLFWRMLYTFREEDNKIFVIAFIIEIIDHKKYNKRFGYKKH
jgi:hypothetical protein